jgi:hypothetical protein
MTVKQVPAMFAVGDEWISDNTYSPRASAPRVLVEMRSTQFIWKTRKRNAADEELLQEKPCIRYISHHDGNAGTKVSSRREMRHGNA